MADTLHIHLLGQFRLRCGDEPVTSIDKERLQSLLAYLALHRGMPQSRRHLAYSFWPDSTEKQAFGNLRNLLFRLRRALPEADRFLSVDTQTLLWRSDAPFTLDVADFEHWLARAEDALQRAAADAARTALEEAVRCYRGELLSGLYDDWILPERERLHQQCTRALEQLIQLLESSRAYGVALQHTQRLLQLDPLREATYRLLMRLHTLHQDRASALRAYHQCVEVLRRELDLEPEPATRDLYARISSVQDIAHGETAPSEAPVHEIPLVGRHREWKRLREAWQVAARGKAHLLVVAGEGGVGKTRLAEELLAWAGRQGIATARTQSYAGEGRLAYAPVTDWLRADALRTHLAALDAVWLAEVSRLLPELHAEHPDLPAPEPLREGWQRQRLLEALARAVLAGGRPLLLLLDDLQWCDQDTLEWLRFLLRFGAEAPLLLLSTVRAEELERDHPVRALLLDLGRTGQAAEIALQPLDADDTARLAQQVAGRELGELEAARLFRETEGNPLFVVESVRAGLPAPEHQTERAVPGDPAIAPARRAPALPPTVHAVIAKRLTQLSPDAQALAGLAATVGRAFTFEVLLRAGAIEEEQLVQALDELWERRIVREHGTNAYDFTHDKLREVAYAEITPVRRRLLHRRVAEALETVHAQRLDAVSAQVAVHYDLAGRIEPAIAWYQRAANVVQQVYANEEVVKLLTRALALLEDLPESGARDERELTLLSALGPALIAARGWAAPEVGRVYARARLLCQQMGETLTLLPVLWGLWTFRLVRAELAAAHELSEAFLHLAEEQQTEALVMAGHFALLNVLFHLGELPPARAHLEKAITLPGAPPHRTKTILPGVNVRVFCLSYVAHLQWHLGYPDQALAHIGDALGLADASSHPFVRAIALSYAAMLRQFRREHRAVQERAEAAVALCAEHGFAYYLAWGTLLEGWARAGQGEPDAGIAQMRRGLASLRATGAVLREPYYLVLLAEACGRAGQVDEGLVLLSDAQAAMDRSSERWVEAELHRVHGELLLAQGASVAEAEARLRQAVAVARGQQARSLELRAVMSLGGLWHGQGRTGEARAYLQAVYARFTEGFDTPDLTEARILLEAWG